MKLAAAFAACLLATACEKTPSKLDTVTQKAPPVGAGGAGANSADVAELMRRVADLEQSLKKYEQPLNTLAAAVDREAGKIGGADVTEGRLRSLEQNLAKREEALAFLDMAWAQQKAQRDAQEAQEPDPNAIFAVNIDEPVKAGQVDGSSSAFVTVVEAWDYA